MVERAEAVTFVDMNILPVQYRPRPMLVPLAILILVMLAALAPLYPLYESSVEGGGELAGLQAQAKNLDARLTQLGMSVREASAVHMEITNVTKEEERLKQEYWDILGSQRLWSSALPFVFHTLPPGIRLTSVTLEGHDLTIRGEAPDSAAVLSYIRNLQQSGQFPRVRVGSITRTTGGARGMLTFAIVAARYE